MRSLAIISILTSISLVLIPGCPTSPGGESDIPCFNPSAWDRSVRRFNIKVAGDVLTGLLLRPDFRDEGGVGPTYHFSPSDETFTLVDDSIWEQVNSISSDCTINLVRDSPFRALLFPPRTLSFEDEIVSTIGRNGVRILYPPTMPSIVYVSTDGDVDINDSGSSGQIFYQIFSELDGSALSEPIQIGITGRGVQAIRGCFSRDERLVIFHQNVFNTEFEAKICIGEMP